MNDRDRKDLFTVEDPFEDEQAPAPAIAADAPGARQAAEAPFCEPGLDAVIASAFDRMGPSAAAEERLLQPIWHGAARSSGRARCAVRGACAQERCCFRRRRAWCCWPEWARSPIKASSPHS